MTAKAFWRNSRIAVIGAGSWGTILANLVAKNCREVQLWTRTEQQALAINSQRFNQRYLPEYRIDDRVHASSDFESVLGRETACVIWALPSEACREQARRISGLLRGDEIILHATKGIERGSLKRISQVLAEELPCRRIGVISGPNLAHEVARGDPSATVVASHFDEAVEAGQILLTGERFRAYSSSDVVGVEWAGSLKNILAIASGALDSLNLGWNAKAMLITRGLVEMVRLGLSMGAKESTFIGLAGLGDLLATCGSSYSRNYRVGLRLGKGEKLEAILPTLGGVAEGVHTTATVRQFAEERKISMPITEGVLQLLNGVVSVPEVIQSLMSRPLKSESFEA
ncbi:MAG TPA: NAD(P)H-dependent glycerol-3-phosphate dehydrogenase [Bdellovibrionota bacterium]|nr:NAD(P)H-dependent glycerol-3-phosphate dehydrogenase [Bdellovibrionota bacterium]